MRWQDIDEIVASLEENYPDEDISRLTKKDVNEYVRSLNEFEDHEIEPSPEELEEILEKWEEKRMYSQENQ